MNLLTPHQIGDPHVCSYQPGQSRRDQYFLAENVTAQELDKLLSEGWRKFGPYFFKPSCNSCHACTPVRIPVNKFRPNRSQKRALSNGKALDVSFGPLNFSPKAFELFRKHSMARFGVENNDIEDFLFHFYTPSCPALQISIFFDRELVGVGWLDRGEISLSSVYFCFDPKHSDLSLGTYSVLAGLDYAREQGLQWNYLGYFVDGNRSTVYKNNFRPHEHFDWMTGEWQER